MRAIDSKSISIRLGNRTLAMNLESMDAEQLDVTRRSAEFLIKELSSLRLEDTN